MKTVKQFALVVMALVIATPALAGTKYQTNIVSNSPTHPPANPTLSPKSAIKLDDKGKIQASLAGVTDGSGALVTTSGSFNSSGTLDASTYIVILKLHLPAIAGLFEVVEFPIPVDLKNGKGKTKYNVSSLFAFLTPPNGRTVEIRGLEVWGPMGAGAAACDALVSGPLPVIFPPDMTCRSGDHIGISGLAVP